MTSSLPPKRFLHSAGRDAQATADVNARCRGAEKFSTNVRLVAVDAALFDSHSKRKDWTHFFRRGNTQQPDEVLPANEKSRKKKRPTMNSTKSRVSYRRFAAWYSSEFTLTTASPKMAAASLVSMANPWSLYS